MKKLLIVVDYQNDFVSGSLGFAKAPLLEPVICSKIEGYRAQGQQIIYTMDTHGEDYLETQEGKNLPVPHCIRGTEGWQLYGKVRGLLEGCTCLEKDTFGCLDLFHFLQKQPYESIELVGLVSNICIVSNAVIAKTVQPQAEVIVDAAGTASNDDTMNEKVLDVLQGIQVRILNR